MLGYEGGDQAHPVEWFHIESGAGDELEVEFARVLCVRLGFLDVALTVEPLIGHVTTKSDFAELMAKADLHRVR
jgi:hypothetical protein